MNYNCGHLILRNIVIFRHIFSFVRLYKKNEYVEFNDIKTLQEYKEKEFISKLVYNSSYSLILGDLPIYGVLKEVKFKCIELSNIKGDLIPYGVEILEYSQEYTHLTSTTPFSTLPSTIHTLKNVSVSKCKTFKSKIQDYKIPPNITSISFNNCINISPQQPENNQFITIPNTIKSLSFNRFWNNDNIILNKGDIPDSITYLSMIGYNNVRDLTSGVLPNSITELHISCNNGNSNSEQHNNGFQFIPLNLQSLYIESDSNIITSHSNLFNFSSIQKLHLQFSLGSFIMIKSNLLPPNLTDLKLNSICSLNDENIIPKNVTNLDLDFRFSFCNGLTKGTIPKSVTSLRLNSIITIPDILTESLTNLELFGDGGMDDLFLYSGLDSNESEEVFSDFTKMISILPQSVTSITLPEMFKDKKDFKINFPSTINKINYL